MWRARNVNVKRVGFRASYRVRRSSQQKKESTSRDRLHLSERLSRALIPTDKQTRAVPFPSGLSKFSTFRQTVQNKRYLTSASNTFVGKRCATYKTVRNASLGDRSVQQRNRVRTTIAANRSGSLENNNKSVRAFGNHLKIRDGLRNRRICLTCAFNRNDFG